MDKNPILKELAARVSGSPENEGGVRCRYRTSTRTDRDGDPIYDPWVEGPVTVQVFRGEVYLLCADSLEVDPFNPQALTGIENCWGVEGSFLLIEKVL